MTSLESLVCTVLEIDPDTPGEVSRATHGEWTSIKQVQIMVIIEETYDVEFSGAEMATGTSTSRLRDLLAAKGVTV
jgi:acyl carrier protein